MIGRFLAQPHPQTRESAGVTSDLPPREQEVTALVGTGLSNAEIAEHLFISTTTAKTHANRAMMKDGARDRAQLVVFAYETGLTVPRQLS